MSRRIRLSDTTADGRLRLDAVARYLQDAATDDVEETGWGAPEHLWVLRSVRIDIRMPFLADAVVEVVTWGSSFSALAAGRRWSLAGDAGGAVEVDSTWIHLDAEAQTRVGVGLRLLHLREHGEELRQLVPRQVVLAIEVDRGPVGRLGFAHLAVLKLGLVHRLELLPVDGAQPRDDG